MPTTRFGRLEVVLADAVRDADILRREGHAVQADSIQRLAERVRTAAADFLEWISEEDAYRRSGHGPDFFKARRKRWAEDDLAEQRGRLWWYRRLIVPRRKLDSIVRAEGRRARSA